jgi:branched-chain amino acid transport system substrate-binding protein
MKKNLFSVSIVILATLVLGVFSGCGKKENNIIKIGVIAPLSGEGATYGMAMKRGIDLAIEDQNSNGGLLGKTIVSLYEDDKLNQKDGINAFNKLVNSDNVQVIIGSAASKVTLAIAPFAEKSKVVLISSISTADTIKYAGDYIFRDVPPNNKQGITAAKFVYDDLKKRKAVVFYKNDDYGLSLSKSFVESFQERGGDILLSESYQPSAKNFRDQLIKIKAKKPEIIFFPGNYEESGLILKQARELNIDCAFVGGDGSYSPELIKLAGNAAENTYYTLMSLPPDTNKMYSQFRAKYMAKYKEEPDVYSVYSYDAANVVFEAIKKSEEYNGSKIKDALYKVDYPGVTGQIKFDNYGEVVKDYSIYIVKNSSFVLYK